MNWLRRIFAALTFALPDFHYGKDEASGEGRPMEPIDARRVRYAPGGALEEVRKNYGVTIAGGPGSQKIGDTFDALPQAEKDRMIAARKGVIRQLRPDENNDQHEEPYVWRDSANARIARGLDKVMKARKKL
jgi:hypothetical protein